MCFNAKSTIAKSNYYFNNEVFDVADSECCIPCFLKKKKDSHLKNLLCLSD